jgi:hypothetical protein
VFTARCELGLQIRQIQSGPSNFQHTYSLTCAQNACELRVLIKIKQATETKHREVLHRNAIGQLRHAFMDM